MLITSISGIRGTIGGLNGENLTPVDVVAFASAYGLWIRNKHTQPMVVVGRDARISGSIILDLVVSTLCSLGIDVLDLGLAATPTVEMMVTDHGACGGLIVTASHNPKEYNGLKMLDEYGEFLSHEQGLGVLSIARSKKSIFADVDNLGVRKKYYNHHQDHVQKILDLDLVDVDLVRSKKYKIALDAINSVGGVAAPLLLEKMGVEVVGLYLEPNGNFEHSPEPLEKNLIELKELVLKTQSDLGIAVDPDVDRLVMVDEKGEMFGEEYTIVSVADFVLSKTPGPVVSNLSSSRALPDLAASYSVSYEASAVGEKNVVEKMKEVGAVIGGEGSGGVIYPKLHYGRDALVGIALFLTHIARLDLAASKLRKRYSNYAMAKEKISLTSAVDLDEVLSSFYKKYQNERISNIDGVKINFEDSWVHLRKSNTEPIIRIYTESGTQAEADSLAQRFVRELEDVISKK